MSELAPNPDPAGNCMIVFTNGKSRKVELTLTNENPPRMVLKDVKTQQEFEIWELPAD